MRCFLYLVIIKKMADSVMAKQAVAGVAKEAALIAADAGSLAAKVGGSRGAALSPAVFGGAKSRKGKKASKKVTQKAGKLARSLRKMKKGGEEAAEAAKEVKVDAAELEKAVAKVDTPKTNDSPPATTGPTGGSRHRNRGHPTAAAAAAYKRYHAKH
jgi:hypothetical protein